MRAPYTKCCDCGPEFIEWTCAKCVVKDAEALEND